MKKTRINIGKHRLPIYLDDDCYDNFSDDFSTADSGNDDDDICVGHDDNLSRELPLLDLALMTSQPLRSKDKKPMTVNKCKSTEVNKCKSTEAAVKCPLDSMPHKSLRLVRSKSFESDILPTTSTTRLQHRQPSLCTSSVDPTCLKQPRIRSSYLATRCMQSLISVKLSVVGPTPRASLSILSDEFRSAILILWYPLRVIPLMNCSPNVALTCQSKIQTEVRRGNLVLNDTWLSHWRLSTFILERRQLWTAFLNEVMDKKAESSPWTIITDASKKAGMRLGTWYSHYDLLKDYIATNQSLSRGTSTPVDVDNPEARSGNSCLICMDEVSDSCELLPCGHIACMGCYASYLKSAANSGQGSILCAGYKCKVQVDMFDAAHILHDDVDIFQRLVRFALERSVANNSRFCPSPHCGNHIKASRYRAFEADGFNIAICDCGTSVCNDCEDRGGPAHPGVSCTDFSKLQKSIDSELETIKWVLKNSRPCPECRFPIEKDGGCNHVRCRQCNFYFCFECGGEGQLCMAYSCGNNVGGERYWQDDNAYGDGYVHKLLSMCAVHRSTTKRLATMLREIGDDVTISVADQRLKIQCTQVLLWMYTFSMCRNMSKSLDNTVDSAASIGRLSLEWILQAFELRQSTESQFGSKVIGHRNNPRHCKSIKAKRPDNNNFHKLLADQELADLLNMSNAEFAQRAKDAIQRGIETLTSSDVVKSRRRRCTEKKVDLNAVYPLNEKQERSTEGWKNDVPRRARLIPDSNKRRNIGAWKNSKIRASTFRTSALEANDV